VVRFELVTTWSSRFWYHIKELFQFNNFKLLSKISKYNLYYFLIILMWYGCYIQAIRLGTFIAWAMHSRVVQLNVESLDDGRVIHEAQLCLSSSLSHHCSAKYGGNVLLSTISANKTIVKISRPRLIEFSGTLLLDLVRASFSKCLSLPALAGLLVSLYIPSFFLPHPKKKKNNNLIIKY